MDTCRCKVCVIYVHSFTLSFQTLFHLFMKTHVKTNQLLADNSLLMLPTASYSLQLMFALSKTVTAYWKIKLNCYIITQRLSSSIT